MSSPRYHETFNIEAVKQVTERGRPVAEVAKALGVSNHSLYVWLKQNVKPAEQQHEKSALQAEIHRLKAELRQTFRGINNIYRKVLPLQQSTYRFWHALFM